MKYSVRSVDFPLIFLFLIFFFLNPGRLIAQPATVTIRGIVTTPNGERLDAAGVFLKDTHYNALTTSDGGFVLKSVPPGNYHLVCTYIGCKTFEKEITVTDAQVLQLKIVMEPDAHVLEEAVIIGQKEVNTVKRMPETVAVCLVKRLMTAALKSDTVINPRPSGNSRPPIFGLSGTFHSRVGASGSV